MKKNCFKSILSLVLLVLGLAVSGSANATISSTAATSITSGSKYLISYTNSGTTYYLAADGSTTTTASEANAMTITTNGSTCTIQNASGSYLQQSGTISFGTGSASFSYVENGSTFTFSYSITNRGTTTYYLRCANSSKNFQFGNSDSYNALVLYLVNPSPAAPTFTPTSGKTFTSSLNVTITCATTDATIYYTTDGSTPSASSTQYTSAITLNATTTIKAIAINTNGSSSVAEASYTKVNPNFVSGSDKIIKKGETTSPFTVAEGFTGTITYTLTGGSGIATIDQETGVVTGVGEGIVTITASTEDTQTGYTTNEVTITVQVSDAHIPTAYSNEWTSSNVLYLYNKGTGLYLSSGGHWGTEGLLKTTGLPVYPSIAGASKADVTGVELWSNEGKTKAWGYVSSAQQWGVENHGLYLDATNNYPDQTFSFYYNSDDNSYSIVPDAMVTGVAISYQPSTNTTLYLRPTSTSALEWSTVAYYWSLDSSNHIYTVGGTTASSLGTKYYLYNSSNTLTLSTSYSTCAKTTDGYLTVGGAYLNGGSTTLTSDATEGLSAEATIYEQGTDTKFYLTQTGGTSTARQNIVTCKQYKTTEIPDIARWFVVTKADLIADFQNATATDAEPKEATFYVPNNDFSREVTQSWTLTNGTTYSSSSANVGTFAAGYTRIGNSLYNVNAGPAATIETGQNKYNSVEDDWNNETTTGVISSTASYTGNGAGYTLSATDADYASLPAGTSTYYNVPYGGFFNCRILGESGSVYQTITGLKKGYYRVSLDAYVYNPSGATGTGSLSVVATNTDGSESTNAAQSATVSLKENTTFETMTQAGITFYANGGASDYRQYATVYVPGEGSNVTIKIALAGGTLSDGYTSSTNTFLELDAVKLEYTGDAETSIILNENDYGTTTYGTSEYNYIQAQVGTEARTLYLQRLISANCWNSIVLPVNISTTALKGAFGSDVQLGEYEKTEDNIIYFKEVDLDKVTTAITAGNFYILKPTTSNGQTSGDYETPLTLTGDSYKITASAKSPVFTFTQITMASVPTAGNGFDKKFTPSVGDKGADDYWSDAQLSIFGTYFAKEDAIDQYSYAIASGNHSENEINAAYAGNWVHYVGEDPLDVLGFRCWIGPVSTDPMTKSKAAAASYSFMIDGVQEDATEIKGVSVNTTPIMNNKVYTVNGQMVRSNATDLNSLPKGIYIVNGKKYVVK